MLQDTGRQQAGSDIVTMKGHVKKRERHSHDTLETDTSSLEYVFNETEVSLVMAAGEARERGVFFD